MSVSPPFEPGLIAHPEPLGRPVRPQRAVPVLLLLGIVAVLALYLAHDQVRYYRVDSGSMRPTLSVGARLAVAPGLSPRVGDIVAFDAPAGAVPATPVCGAPGQGAGYTAPCGVATAQTSRSVFLKRVVAGPGDLVALRDGHAVVNGQLAAEPFAAACGDGPDCTFPTPIRLAAGQYYVLGDNRGVSDDSRFWGPVSADAILGVAVRCHALQTACARLG